MAHKDWMVVNVVPNIYDRAHTGYDLVKVEDSKSLMNSIILRLMTIYKEINHTVYTNYGNLAWIYIGQNMTPQAVVGVRDYTNKALGKITRIRRVKDIDAWESTLRPHEVVCRFEVEMDTGETITEGVSYSD